MALERRGIAILLGGIFLWSCGRQTPGNSGGALFTLLPSSVTHAGFVNHLDFKKQIEDKFNIYTYRNFYNGCGVALADINNDGLLDIFLTSNMGKNTLYLNKGNFRFQDISAEAGVEGTGQWSTGASIADVNGDGWPDIYVCNSGNLPGDEKRNELFINNGDLTFTEKAAEYGIDDTGYSTHAAFFDFDRDGDLDLYVLNNSSRAIGSFDLKNNLRSVRDSLGGDKLYKNEGNIFRDVSKEAGIYGSVIGFGMGVTIGDINLDGWPDIYVSNDFFERDYLYLNNQDGTFRENLTDMIQSVSEASMGADMADINNDGYPEIYVTDMVPEHNDRMKTKTTFDDWEGYKSNAENGYYFQFTRNMLQLNNRDGTFSEIGRLAGVASTDWSWGALITDLDNDGLKDIFVANGIYKDLTDQDYIRYFSDRDMIMSIISGSKVDYKTLIESIPSVRIPNYAFKNLGNYRFQNMAEAWGLATPSHSNGSAYGDLDNDGDLDIVVSNVNMPLFIYRNETNERLPGNHYLKFILKGEKGNTDAIGAKVTAVNKGKITYVEQIPSRGFLSSVDPRPNLGLGPLTMVDSVIVEWPDERITLLTNVKSNQSLTLYQKDAVTGKGWEPVGTRSKNSLFKELPASKTINFAHTESDFNDFERERLLYHMLSTEGPGMCRGDVNGDGLEDIYLCGAKGQAGALMLQQKDGSFEKSDNKTFEEDKISEDIDCEMFDADNDGDLDLYVASGGNELPESSSALADRLYFNDGKGHFVKSSQVLPAGKFESTSCVRAGDFDKDGINELFVGIRLKPFLYGVPVNGYLLENDGKGNFYDVTSKIAPELTGIGMIRDMLWEDVDGDSDLDIILAGDWMPLKVLINENGRFTEKIDAFDSGKTNGWWNCLAAGDFDDDGDIDFIAGNLGLNSRFRATEQKPVSMYVNDFDLNGKAEQIICVFDGDTSFPLALKHDLVQQIPALGKKYPTFKSYKNQTIGDIFSDAQLKGSIHLDSYLMETSLFLNEGKGSFARKELPVEVQFSPVYAAKAGDFDGDGKTDLILGGNLYNVKPEVGRYDASYGSFLRGDGKGGFTYVPPMVTGLHLKGEIRKIEEVKTGSGSILVAARSNDSVQVFRMLDK